MNTVLSNFNSILLILLVSFSPVIVAKHKSNVSLEDASEYIREQFKGKVLSARTTTFNGIRMHRIQVLTPSGRVKIFQVPSFIKPNQNRSAFNKKGWNGLNNNSAISKNYYQNNYNRTNGSINTRYATPKSYSHSQSSVKGESKQK